MSFFYAKFFRQSVFMYITAIFGSLLLTGLLLSYRQPINVDGVYQYLKAAHIISTQGFKAVFSVSQWPFYPWLIVLISHITTLSLEYSARVLDSLSDVLTVIAFLLILKEAGASRRIQWFGLLVILFFPSFEHTKLEIVRDHGYLAFALLSFWFFIRYMRSLTWKDAVGWGLSIGVATLFRIEGAFLAVLVPFVWWFKPQFSFLQKLKLFLKAYVVQWIALLAIVVGAIFLTRHHGSLKYLGRLSEFRNAWVYGASMIWQAIQGRVSIVAKSMIPMDPHEPFVFVLGGLILIFIDHIISVVELVYLVLACYALKGWKQFHWHNSAVLGWLSFTAVNGMVVFCFLAQQFFLINRYVHLLATMLLLLAPFGIEAIYQNWKNKTNSVTGSHWLFPLVCLGLLYVAAGSIGHFGPSFTCVLDAGDWVKGRLPASARFYMNTESICYYADRYGRENSVCDQGNNGIRMETLSRYDYLVLYIDKYDDGLRQLLKTLPLKEIQTFYNRNGDHVGIFMVEGRESLPKSS